MALNANMYPPRALGGEKVLLMGNLQGNDAVAVVAADYEGIPGASWTRDDTGVYTLTLPGKGSLDIQTVVATVQVESVATGVKFAALTARDESARTLTFTVFEITLASGITAAADMTDAEWLNVLVTVRNTHIKNA